MNHRRSQLVRTQRLGAAVVEMALVTPFLVLLFLGMTELGSIFYTRHTMVLAAREGARQMAVEGATEQEAADVTNEYLSDFHINDATVTMQTAYKGNGDDAAARRVNVQIQVPFSDASSLGDALNLFAGGALMTVDVSMRKEGELLTAP